MACGAAVAQPVMRTASSTNVALRDGVIWAYEGCGARRLFLLDTALPLIAFEVSDDLLTGILGGRVVVAHAPAVEVSKGQVVHVAVEGALVDDDLQRWMAVPALRLAHPDAERWVVGVIISGDEDNEWRVEFSRDLCAARRNQRESRRELVRVVHRHDLFDGHEHRRSAVGSADEIDPAHVGVAGRGQEFEGGVGILGTPGSASSLAPYIAGSRCLAASSAYESASP